MDTSIETPKSSSKTWLLVLGCFLGLSCLLLMGTLGCFGALAWIANQENVNATATAQQGIVIQTATAEALATEISAKGLFDSFNSNENGWMVGAINKFWEGKIDITDGKYVWKVEKLNKGFLTYSYMSNGPVAKDFDIAVDARIEEGDFGVCSGILFRTSPYGWEYGGYAFSVCKEGQFFVGYVDEEGTWVKSSGWTKSPAIKLNDWNHIEVNTRGSHFILKINDFIVYEMDDSNRADGKVALFIEIHETNNSQGWLNDQEEITLVKAGVNAPKLVPVTFLFDNFRFQSK